MRSVTVAGSSRAQALATPAAGAAAALVGVLAVAASLRHLFVSEDTGGVVAGVDSALAHLRAGQLLHWGGAYPLLQAIPTAVLRLLDVPLAGVLDSLVALNIVSFVLLTWISWRAVAGRSPTAAIALVSVLLSSTLLWYMHSTFGEPLAALATLGAVVACWRDERHVRAAALLFLAGLSKDTAVPFLLLLCLGASAGTPLWTSARWRWRRVASLVLAGGLSFLVTCAYNYARFGSVLDVPYTASYRFVPWLQTQASFFAAVWLSPNGGLLLFWPSFGALLALATVAGLRAIRACPDPGARLRRAAPLLGGAAVLLGMTMGLSKWFAPLGWGAWGSRLMLPWVPAAAYLLVAAYPDELTALVRRIAGSPLRAWLAGGALAVATLPQYVAMVRSQLWDAVWTPDATCPTEPVIEHGAVYYYHCMNHMFWTKTSMLVLAFRPSVQLLVGCACAGSLLWLLWLLRRSATAGAGWSTP